MKILVIVDMQNDFTSGVLGNNECEEAVSKVVEVINEDNYVRFFLQGIHIKKIILKLKRDGIYQLNIA